MHEKFVGLEHAYQLLGKPGTEIAVVKNPDYIFPEFDLYPLSVLMNSVRIPARPLLSPMRQKTEPM